jgi:Flp pilus assembly protein TadD
MVQITERDLADLIKKDIDTEKYSDAELKLLRWLEIEPEKAVIWLYLGYLYRQMGKIEASYAAYQRVLSLDPDNPQCLSNFGNLHSHKGDAKGGIKYLRKAHKLDPDSELYKQNLTYALRDAGEFEEAIQLQREIVAADPENTKKQFELGFMLLYARELDEAWELYDKRFRTDQTQDFLNRGKTLYDGQSLKGKSILVIGEQGFGDTLLMLRFMKKLVDEAKSVEFVTRAPLFPVLKDFGMVCYDQYDLPEGFDPGNYDYVIDMMSLAKIMEKDWCKWPANPKLPVPEDSRKKMDTVIRPRPQKINIGIVWSGSVTFKYNHIRATDYERFLDLAGKHTNIQFFSMQKGPRERDILDHGMGSILPIGHKLDHFGDTAAALEHMDLLLMTDSGLAHLAGTQDVPVLNLLNYFHYWLYYPQENTSPLYPSWRFIRQPKGGDWDSVFKQASKILGELEKAAEKSKKDRLSSKEILKIIDSGLK